jgi:hypothetical protein
VLELDFRAVKFLLYIYTVLELDASYQGSFYLAKLCQSRRFLEIDQSEKTIVCGGHAC